jgi:hypothetical protein
MKTIPLTNDQREVDEWRRQVLQALNDLTTALEALTLRVEALE